MAVVILQQGRPMPARAHLVSFANFQSRSGRFLFVAYEIVTSVMPRAFACSYISPSTSLDTAEVHSSRTANCGR